MKILTVFILPLFVMMGCTPSTTLKSSWRDPNTQVKMGQFTKVLVVAFVKNETGRRTVEDDIVKLLKAKGIPSYQYLGANSKLTQEELAAKISEDAFDGAVVMRLVDKENETEYVQGTGTYPSYYNGFGSYYGSAYGGFNDPGYYKENKIYSVETNMYSLKENKLIWSGVTNTVNPSDLDKMIEQIGKVVTEEMKKQGFLY
jgi:hypothetical protein